MHVMIAMIINSLPSLFEAGGWTWDGTTSARKAEGGRVM